MYLYFLKYYLPISYLLELYSRSLIEYLELGGNTVLNILVNYN